MWVVLTLKSGNELLTKIEFVMNGIFEKDRCCELLREWALNDFRCNYTAKITKSKIFIHVLPTV